MRRCGPRRSKRKSRAEFEGIGRNKENPDRPETIGALSRHARPIHLVPAMRLGMAGSMAPVLTSCSNTNTVIRGLSIRFDVEIHVDHRYGRSASHGRIYLGSQKEAPPGLW